MSREIKFRAWIAKEKYMAIQGTPDLENLKSFMFHYGDEEILMQYSGLKDGRGNEIYEGDIVKYGWRNLFVVFSNGEFKFFDKYNRWERYIDTNEMLIIGNIYENYEML